MVAEGQLAVIPPDGVPRIAQCNFFAAPVVVEFGKPIFLTCELRDQFDNRHRVKNLEMRCVGVPR
jgi:hypothetical protein